MNSINCEVIEKKEKKLLVWAVMTLCPYVHNDNNCAFKPFFLVRTPFELLDVIDLWPVKHLVIDVGNNTKENKLESD